jgi:hypothetical protein
MKQTLILILVVVSLISLVGCGSAQGNVTSPANGAIPGAARNGTASAGQMPESMQLAIAMFKLDKTSYPISKEQAATLLFLWKGARTLSSDDTVSSEELSGLYKQIQGALTSEQLNAIKDMDLKMSDMQTLSQELGINLGMGRASAGAPSSGAASSGSSNAAGGSPGGGFVGGVPMGGPPGGGPMGGGSSTSSLSTTPKQGSFMGLSSTLIDQIITYLAAKV